MLSRTECRVDRKLADKKVRQLYAPTKNAHDIFPPCYLPLYCFVALLQSTLLRLNNFHRRRMHKIYYFAALLHSLDGKAFDNEPPEVPRSDFAESGDEEAQVDEFE